MSGSLRAIRSHDEFDQILAEADRPVLVDVGASWCAPCQELTPILEEFAAAQTDVLVVALDADDPRNISWRLGGGTIPRMFLFDRGVLQMQVAAVRSRAWLDDVVGGYLSLGVEPDGVRLPPRSPQRTVTLPRPLAGRVGLMVIHGHDNGFSHDAVAPATVDVTPDSLTVLNIDTDAIESGYLRQLDPVAIDHIRVNGVLEAKHVDELLHLTSLQCIQGAAIDQMRFHEQVQQAQAAGDDPDVNALLAEAERGVTLRPDDLAPLSQLPLLRRVDVLGLRDLSTHLPSLIGGWWLAPGLAAARTEAGLPEYDSREPSDDQPFTVGCLLTRDDHGRLQLRVNLTIQQGWYAYPPASPEGVPVSVALLSDHRVTAPLAPESPAEHLTGKAALVATLEGDSDEVRVEVKVQVCDGQTCLAPVTTRLVVPLMRR